jgi:16S rRNA processing protein RimM
VDGLPALLCEGLEVWPVPPALKGPRSRIVERVSGDEGGQLVTLSGVSDLAQAEDLRGKTLLALADDLPDDLCLRDARALVGRPVEDVRAGYIGELTEVLLGSAQDVYVIEGPAGEVLVPAVDAFVRSVEGTGPIVVELSASMLPAGLDADTDGGDPA